MHPIYTFLLSIFFHFQVVVSSSLRNVENHSRNGKALSYLDSKPIHTSISLSLSWQVQITTFYSIQSLLFVHDVAGIVGYVTNYVGVSMLFYPITWTGIPVRRWPNQPLGMFGWQGIVPAKRFAMANKLVIRSWWW